MQEGDMNASGKLIVDGKGKVKTIFDRSSFPDKKEVQLDPILFETIANSIRALKEGAEVGQKEATWIPKLEYPDSPMLFLFLTDTHYLSTRADLNLLNHFIDTVDQTPNMFVVTGGDDVDNFNVTLGKVATGVYEDPFEAGYQARAWAKKMQKLDEKEKIGFMCFGNHTDWTFNAGIDWYDTYLSVFKCPILTSGGLVHVQLKGAKYDIAATHRYWGTSKLNPTNACKRFLEHEHPSADIILLGHTHQSEVLMFERGGKERVACIGGTLKQYETYARKHGIGGRAGTPGQCIALWPDRQEMQAYKHFDQAVLDHINRL